MSDNIRVAIRMRPLISREVERSLPIYWTAADSTRVSQVSHGSDEFCFDRVFESIDDNCNVYSELCLPIVQSIMQGFNGTVFAYGQTSSGKTYTMMGEHNGIYKGVIQYAIEDIFNIIQTMPEREFLLRVSFLEIYNEKVFDLLSDKNDDLRLLEDSYGIVKANGLQEKIVQTSDQIWEWLRKGQKKRRTGETQMNRVSSRSHFIFRMIVESRLKDEEDSVVNVSQLNLVDLAGSENVKQTKTKGDRFKEGIHINLSLSTLSQVISQLSEREDSFINYRNSKLTRLLQNSLGGNALTAIICTVTPASLKETLSTLKFATRAKSIKNKPKKNEILNDQALLKQYANQIKKLSHQLEASKEQGKELEEKTKQNENLKKEIEALRANFVSQTVISKTKAIRRETWGGHLDTRSFPIAFLPPKNTFSSHLAILEEEPEADSELMDFGGDSKRNRSRGSSLISFNARRSVSEVEIQTDPENFKQDPNIEDAMMLVSELKNELQTLQHEFKELNEYTTLEKQLLKADSELQTELEAVKKENCTLRRELEIARRPNLAVPFASGPELNDSVLSTKSQKNKKFDGEAEKDYVSVQLNKNSLANQNHNWDKSRREISKTNTSIDSSLLDESLKSNFLELYDECFESEVVSKLKTVIESLKYDIELKDKQISLFNDKMQIKEQMITSLKEEIALGQNINLCNISNEVVTISKTVTQHVTCQTDVKHSPKKSVFTKECQTSPLKPCDTKNTFDKLGNLETSANFDFTAKENIHTSPLGLFLSDADCVDDEENMKKLSENLFTPEKASVDDSLEDTKISVYTEMSPSGSMNQGKYINCVMEDQLTQVTPVKVGEISTQYDANEIVEHYVQTSPIKGLELFSEDHCDKVDQSTQITQIFMDDCNGSLSKSHVKTINLNLFVDESTQTTPLFDGIEEKSNIKSSKDKIVNRNIDTETDICINKTSSEDTNNYRSEVSSYNSSGILEKIGNNILQNCSDDLKIFINKINELKVYTIELMRNCVKAEYLEDIDGLESPVEDYSLKTADKEIVTLRNLIMRLEFYIKNKEDICEIHNNQLESKFEEVISLDLRLSEAEQALNEAEQALSEKEVKFSNLSKNISNLYQKISELTFICRMLNNIKSEEELVSLKNSPDRFTFSEFSFPEHDLSLIENLVVKLNSYVDENAAKIINLTKNLERIENELFVLKNENLRNSENFYASLNVNSVSKSVQTYDVIDSTYAVEMQKVELQLKNLQKTNCELERQNADLQQKIADLEISHSAEIEALEIEFETSKLDWNKKTMMLVNDIETKYDQELIDQQNKLTEELHEKILQQKEQHLKQVYDLREEISSLKSLHSKQLLDLKEHLEDQIRDLEEQLFSENREKDNLKTQFEREKEVLKQAYQTKCEEIRNKYSKRVNEYQEVNSLLKVKIQHYLKEKENKRKENTPNTQSENFQQLEEKLTEAYNERDFMQKMYTEQIKELQEELKQNRCSNTCKEIEGKNKKLLYDLDQRKAKIMSLESNNASMIQELKKLKEMLSSKAALPRKCKAISRESQTDIQEKYENCKEKRKSNLEEIPENLVTKQESIHDNEYPKENNDLNMQTPNQENVLCIGGGSGPANMVKSYWLEGMIHKKDKEISRLRKELAELTFQIKNMKIRPVMAEEKKSETKRRENVRAPASPVLEMNEDITLQTNTLHPYHGAIPKVQRKQILKEKNGRNIVKPYDQPQATMKHVKKEDTLDWQYPNSNCNRHGYKNTEVVNMLAEPECKQQ